MTYPSQSNFVSAAYGAAYWVAEEAARSRVVALESTGRAVIAQLQNVLYAGVRGGTAGFNRTITRRVKIDGIVGPETLNALWAYGRAAGLTAAQLAPIETDIRNRTFSATTALIGIWLTYHQPRRIDLDVGPAGARTRVQRTDPPLAFAVQVNAIRLPEGTVLPQYLESPGVPEAEAALLSTRPTVVPLDAAGNAIRAQAQVLPVDGTDQRTVTPPTPEAPTFTPAPSTPSTPPTPAPVPAPPTPTQTTIPTPSTPAATPSTQAKASGIRPMQLLFAALALGGVYLVATDR